jgi:hypothetical protein
MDEGYKIRNPGFIRKQPSNNTSQVKVKFSLERAMKAQRGSKV